MKKRKAIAFVVLELIFVLFLGLDFLHLSHRGTYWITVHSIGLELYNGGYRNWEISWSNGESYETNGRMHRLWCKPWFSHNDLRAELGTNFNPGLKHEN